MYELKSREEFIRALRGNDVVLVEYYDPDIKDCEIMHESMKELSKHIEKVLFCLINVKKHPEIDKVTETPTLRVFYRGELIFEQIGTMSTVELNLRVVRRSIREAFQKQNINIRI